MTTEIKIASTWQKRIVDAAVAKAPAACKLVIRRTPRLIGGRPTSKTDLVIQFIGDDGTVAGLVTDIFARLSVGSNAYLRDLSEDLTPTERKLARRAWLEHEATKVAEKMTGGI